VSPMDQRNMSLLLLAGAVVGVGLLLTRKGSAAGCLDTNIKPEELPTVKAYLAGKGKGTSVADMLATARAAELNNHPRLAACIRKMASERGA